MIDASKRDFFLIFSEGWNFKYFLKFLKKFFLYGFILMVCLLIIYKLKNYFLIGFLSSCGNSVL